MFTATERRRGGRMKFISGTPGRLQDAIDYAEVAPVCLDTSLHLNDIPEDCRAFGPDGEDLTEATYRGFNARSVVLLARGRVLRRSCETYGSRIDLGSKRTLSAILSALHKRRRKHRRKERADGLENSILSLLSCLCDCVERVLVDSDLSCLTVMTWPDTALAEGLHDLYRTIMALPRWFRRRLWEECRGDEGFSDALAGLSKEFSRRGVTDFLSESKVKEHRKILSALKRAAGAKGGKAG